MLFKEKGINWNDYPTKYRRGSTISEGIAIRSSWRIDNEIPIFVEELYREIDMMLIGQLIEILKQYDSDREVMIHTLKGENVEVNGYFIPKNLDESIFYLTDLDVIPRN